MVMEFLKGESLAKRLAYLDRQRDLPKLLRCLQQVAEALAWAHHVGVIHRDIKPENVFLVAEPSLPDGERPKVVDFGLAKLGLQQRAADPTHTGIPMGTPLFMPPEQWLDAKRADEKSDAYSFGVMLYEVISGRLPFVASDAAGLLERHLQDTPRSIRDWAPGLPSALVELVHSLLAKQREDRPTMKTVAATLLRVVSESPEALAHVWPPGIHGAEGLPPRASVLGDHMPTASGIDVFAKTLPQGAAKPLARVPAGPNTPSLAAISMQKLKELAFLVRRPAPREFGLPGVGFTPEELAQIESDYRRKLMLGDLRTVFGMFLFPIIIVVLFMLLI